MYQRYLLLADIRSTQETAIIYRAMPKLTLSRKHILGALFFSMLIYGAIR